MTRNEPEYAIRELAEKAGVSVRTIRFYINEGLLPTPQTRGRYTVYNDEYLDRLELIRRLKDSFLPLKEIRATLTSLSWDEVRATLADLTQREAAQPPAPPKEESQFPRELRDDSSSALEYISKLLSSTPVNRPRPPAPDSNIFMKKHLPFPTPGPESWERVKLAEGLELHIRQPVNPESRNKIIEIIDFAKKIFSSPNR